MQRLTMRAAETSRTTEPITREQLGELLDPNVEAAHRAPVVDLAIECLASLIVRARHVQTLYFEARDRGLLIQAKQLEKRLDLIAELVLQQSENVEARTVFVECGDKQLDQAVAAILAGDVELKSYLAQFNGRRPTSAG